MDVESLARLIRDLPDRGKRGHSYFPYQANRNVPFSSPQANRNVPFSSPFGPLPGPRDPAPLGRPGRRACGARPGATSWRAALARPEARRPGNSRAPRIRRGSSPAGTYGGAGPAGIESTRQKIARELRFPALIEGSRAGGPPDRSHGRLAGRPRPGGLRGRPRPDLPKSGWSHSAEAGVDRFGVGARALRVGPTPPVAVIDVALPATVALVPRRSPPIEGRLGTGAARPRTIHRPGPGGAHAQPTGPAGQDLGRAPGLSRYGLSR
jgi:hypothetical protein